MTSIPDVVRHLHTLHDITRKSKNTVNFGELGPVRRDRAYKQLKPTLLEIVKEKEWWDVLSSLATDDKKWASDFSDHLIDSASGFDEENGVSSVDMSIRIWADIDSTSNQDVDRIILEDTTTGRLSSYNYGTWNLVTSKNDQTAAKFDLGLARKVYDKSRHEASWTIESEDSPGGSVYPIKYFNTYTPPECSRVPTDDLDLTRPPAEVEEFLNHLFVGNQELIEWFHGWCHYALTSRAPTVPILSGRKGTGKTMLTQLLMILFGVSRPAPRNFFETRFNAPFLKDNEYCPIDEFPGDLLALRKYMSKSQMVESKGKDSSLAEICTNFTITTNPENILAVAPDERIFAVLDITDKDLREVWSEARIESFVQSIAPDSDDILKTHWYYFIRNFKPVHSKSHIWKGPRFIELVIEGLKSWQAFLREECLRTLERTGPGGELLISKLRDNYRTKRSLNSSGGSIFTKDQTAHFLLKMAEAGDILGTLVQNPKQHILVGIDPRDDLGLM